MKSNRISSPQLVPIHKKPWPELASLSSAFSPKTQRLIFTYRQPMHQIYLNTNKTRSFKDLKKPVEDKPVFAPTQFRQRMVRTLQENILEIQSDTLELKRDLATFEYQSGQALGVLDKLHTILHTQKAYSNLAESFNPTHSVEFQGILEDGLQAIDALSANSPKPKTSVPETYKISSLYQPSKTAPIFSCVRIVSGIHAIFTVRANSLYSYFEVSVSLPAKLELFFKGNFQLGIQEYSDIPAIHAKIHEKIISKLHLEHIGNTMALIWSSDYRMTFSTLLMNIKNVNTLTAIKLLEEGASVVISDLSTGQAVQVNREHITKKRSIFQCSDQELKQTLSQHLVYDVYNRLVLWVNDLHLIQSAKEQVSRLMDLRYLQNAIGTIPLQLCQQGTVQVDGKAYQVSVMSSIDIEKLVITDGETTKAVGNSSALGKWLRKMQFNIFREAPITLMRSMELTMVIRFLFKH